MPAFSVAAMAAAAMVRQRLAWRQGGWNAALIAASSYLITVIVVACILPSINEVPDDFPSGCALWQFRVESFGISIPIAVARPARLRQQALPPAPTP